ncbi:MAG: NADH:ubiquinone oxidoreductase subunit J [Acidiferrobacteraceae bacterium]|nr:NADH:ubiquinone oxidoreductase subunit J [Acidiferrobacteraceae bacterium]|tara:strand:- start:350 stop:979 length:630 start_codon:yes stop_codon:yes gene_type:complete
MSFLQVSFYCFSLILIVAAVRVVTVGNAVKAALYLVLVFFSAACIWITLEAEFLAIVLVLVYVGAVMVLFLFVVMMLDIDITRMRESFGRYLFTGGSIAVIMVIELGIVVMAGSFDLDRVPRPVGHDSEYSNTKELGILLYTDYVYIVELAAILLLVAIIAAIALTLRKRPKTHYQSPSQQLTVTKKERLKIVEMDSETNRSSNRGSSS